MYNELILIILLLTKYSYNKYNSIIDIKYIKDNYKEIYYIYNTLIELHTKTENDLTLDELKGYFYAKYPDALNKIEYEALFTQASNLQIGSATGEEILAAIKQRKTALELSETAFKFTQGFATLEQLKAATEAIKGLPEAVVSGATPVSLDLGEIIESVALKKGIRWRLQFLNKSLGSLRPGDFGMLIKRPETGGTAFCADLEMFAVDQVERPVIHFNNEEEDKKVVFRMYMSYFGCTQEQLRTNWRRYNDIFQEKVAPKYKFFGIEYCNKQDIEAIVEEYDPSLVVYDQLSKIKGFENDRLDLKLGDAAQWGRELTKKGSGHAGVAIHQADGTAEGAKWLDMGHTANAKTALQAEFDWILGMGKTHNPNEESIRYLNISKNKLLGDDDSDPEMRHARGEVIIRPEVMRFQDIINYE